MAVNRFGKQRQHRGILVLIAGLALVGCAGPGEQATSDSNDETLKVYATTGYLADAVANIAPDAEITTMVGPGGDPHTYQPSTRDIETIMNADVVFWNGLRLEAQMIDLLESRGDAGLAVAEELPEDMLLSWPETDAEGNALVDPHVWNSPDAWTLIVAAIAEKLGEVDAAGADAYLDNAATYTEAIARAHADAQRLLEAVPEPRTLITGHDAFNYFGSTYGLTVHATDFVSTEALLSAEDLSSLAELIASKRVPVIFQDNQANPQAINSLREAVRSRGWAVEISDEELYADSLGADPGVDTYLGVFEHNTRAIARALTGSSEG